MLPAGAFAELEEIVHDDPGGRGLPGFRRHGQFLDAGQLAAAAQSLAAGKHVAIATGFCIPTAVPPVAETDGLGGALVLARCLKALSMSVEFVVDSYTASVMRAGARACALPDSMIIEIEAASPGWPKSLLAAHASRWTHLVSIECVGPSHTLASLEAQQRPGPPPRDRFERDVPEPHRDVCHTMRGLSIPPHMAPLYRLFDEVEQKELPITTIGVGDGGNEIGAGRLAWEDICEAVGSNVAGRIACRLPTEFFILAGVSDWGAVALAAATSALRAQPFTRAMSLDSMRSVLEALVDAGAVDGISGRREPTVDGLAWDDYSRPLRAITTWADSVDEPPR